MAVAASYATESINIQSFLLGLLTLLLVRWFVMRTKYNYNLPPGPTSFPIIGNLPQMIKTTDLCSKLKDFRQQYGDIFKLKLGSDTLVTVCKTEWILEGLVKKGDELKGRPYWIYMAEILSRKQGESPIYFNKRFRFLFLLFIPIFTTYPECNSTFSKFFLILFTFQIFSGSFSLVCNLFSVMSFNENCLSILPLLFLPLRISCNCATLDVVMLRLG